MARLFNRYIPIKDLLLFFMEGLIISACVLLAIFIRFLFNYEGILRYEHLLSKILFFTLLCQATIFYNNLYSSNLKEKNRLLFIKLLQSIGIAAVLLAISYFSLPVLIIGRGIFIIAITLLLPVLFIWRIYYQEIPFLRKDDENILIIGTGDLSIEIGKKLIDKGSSGYEVVGYIDENRDRVGQRLFNPSIIGSFDDIIPIVQNKKIDKIIIAMAEMRGKFPVDPLLRVRLDGIEVEEGISFYEKISGKIHVSHLKPGWLIFCEGFQRRRIAIGKRLIDLILSAVGLVLAAPVMLITAILIKLESPGPVLFRQERVGEGEKVFVLLKFRSMRADAESKTGPIWAREDDQRVTRVGRFIRKVRIDELPQMINVLKGDMSFVGPRPERPHFIDMLKKEIPFYSLRHSVKPGITGWAQVRYEYGASVEDAMEKLQYDIYYIKNMSLLFDLSIILETTKTVLLGEGGR